MGAGRKTATYDVDSKAAVHDNKEEAKRNLGEVGKLGGVIFGEHLPLIASWPSTIRHPQGTQGG